MLPYSGPNTTGGCPLLPGATGLCALAQGEGENAFFGTDPQGTCPPTQAEANAGLVQCSLAALTATENGNSYIALALDVAYANDPTPANPTAAITPSTGLSAGQSVTVNACNTCNWWGAGQHRLPGLREPPPRTAWRRPSRPRPYSWGPAGPARGRGHQLDCGHHPRQLQLWDLGRFGPDPTGPGGHLRVGRGPGHQLKQHRHLGRTRP